MDWLSRIFHWVRRSPAAAGGSRHDFESTRRFHFEEMESRRLMSGTPLRVGVVYFEEDSGSDVHGDTFEVTFQGGAAGTQLVRLEISGDRNQPGFDVGDVFFDTNDAGMGADHSFPFTVVSLTARDPSATVRATVMDGGTSLVLDFTHFQAGDKLVFSIDVDEVVSFDPRETDLGVINDGMDPITSGVEFQGSVLTADFVAPGFRGAQARSTFRNRYDETLDGAGLDLPPDNSDGKRDRSAGGVAEARQVPLPIAISGTVFADLDLDLVRDPSESGLGGVRLMLWRKDGNSYVDTGYTVSTNAQGAYAFGRDLNLLPGVYQIRESQPDGWFSVGAIPGKVSGTTTGQVIAGNLDLITEISIPQGDLESVENHFAEASPASIGGWVYHDQNNDGARQTGEMGLADVEIQIIPVSTIGPQTPVSVRTDAQGRYRANGLAPGTYRIVQPSQPAAYYDGLDAAGKVNGLVSGSAVNPGDRLDGIVLPGGASGVDYNFGELAPGAIRGRVHLTGPDGDCFGADDQHLPLAGVRIELRDASGPVLQVTFTDARGEYEFVNLAPGTYSVAEFTPAGAFDGGAHAGTVDGVPVGDLANSNLITGIVLGSGQNAIDYDFCEYPPSSLAGFVYHDQNLNRHRDSGEAGIAGVVIRLWNASGVQVAQAVTDAQGAYRFEHLSAGDYRITQVQPTGWLDADDQAGTVAGRATGVALNPGDAIGQITVRWGEAGIEYNFGEVKAASIAGLVFADQDQDCEFDPGEITLNGVTIQLLNGSGEVVATTTTDSQGRYSFADLLPGTYAVRELQPAGYFHGGQTAGSHGGNASLDDLISQIPIESGQNLTDYNFCDVPPSRLTGIVFQDLRPNCIHDPDEPVMAGVTVRLLDNQNQVVASTVTSSEGRYEFTNLRAGFYTVQEVQPAGFFQGGVNVGSGGGTALSDDAIRLLIPAGAALVDYDFCERPASQLSGYVFQDGPPITLLPGQSLPPGVRPSRDGLRTTDDVPIGGVVLELRDGTSGEPIMGDRALPGMYGPGPIRVVTDSGGYYEFRGIPGNASYAVYQVHPTGYVDGIDTPGTTSGLAINPGETVPEFILERLTVEPKNDAIILIPLGIGQNSQNNNFSEIRTVTIGPPPETPPNLPPAVNLPPPQVAMFPPGPLAPAWTFPRIPTVPLYGGQDVAYSWHLSVINGGAPRQFGIAGNAPLPSGSSTWYVRIENWQSVNLAAGQWMVQTNSESSTETAPSREYLLGTPGGLPVTGDFDGDGDDDIGVYVQGTWYVDLNGNGRWDEEDLWIRLGEVEDQPVTGDFDGDGKADVGIFGPRWSGDERALRAEPGLPDQANRLRLRPKNPPPNPDEATDGVRVLQRAEQGPPRADVIDHVFQYGTRNDRPVTGDWNGDGIDTIGVFRHGRWFIDLDGDGTLTDKDLSFVFGQEGDLPVVGDFDGDGLADAGVFRQGTWILDTNRNREIDAHDRVFQMGEAHDLPVVGDWNGDGVDEPGVYRPASGDAVREARKAS